MFKLIKNLPIQGMLEFQDSEGGFDKDRGKFRGLRPPSELCCVKT